MAVVLKRDSELGKLKKKMKRKERIDKVMEPVYRFFRIILFILFTLFVLAFSALVCYAVIKAIGELYRVGTYLTCGVAILLAVYAEIKAGKACLRKKEKKKEDPSMKGAEGEEKVTEYIEENFSNEYFLINDINVRCNGRSSQFDHILVCPRGIFCLETKNYSGNYTPVGEDTWSFYTANGKTYMESPQQQSCYHVSVLSELYHKEKRNMYPLVIFANKKAKYNGNDKPCPVLYLEGLEKEIKSHQKVYTKSEAKKIAKKLLSFDVGVSKFAERGKRK